MMHHLVPRPPLAIPLTPLRSPPPVTETVPTVLDLDRRIQFVQRLAVLIRRMQPPPPVRAQEDQPDES